LEKIKDEDDELLRERIKIVPYSDPLYPEQLKEIVDPPPCLYLKGSFAPFSKPSVAIVGSRNATIYGLNVAETISKDLALNGVAIVSGLARGIDSSAHKGSLCVKGAQIGVLGTGIDIVYPKDNEKLFEDVLKNDGAILTEFPPKTPPLKKNFPTRNRIIAGLSWGVLIVEAEERSGSLVTARFAVETGKEVFAIPHNITSSGGVGPNLLIQKGAKLVMSVQDILDEMPDFLKSKLLRYNEQLLEIDIPSLPLSEEEFRILKLLRKDETRSIDSLIELGGLSLGKTLSVISSLKIKGLCEEHPGNRFSRKEN
jgi:DNA processing protein